MKNILSQRMHLCEWHYYCQLNRVYLQTLGCWCCKQQGCCLYVGPVPGIFLRSCTGAVKGEIFVHKSTEQRFVGISYLFFGLLRDY